MRTVKGMFSMFNIQHGTSNNQGRKKEPVEKVSRVIAQRSKCPWGTL